MDEVKAKLDSVHMFLRRQVCLVENAEAVDIEGRAEVEEDVIFISGTGFDRSVNQNGNFYGQRSNFNQSSQQQKPYNNNYSSNNMGYGNSYYQKPPPPTQKNKNEEMLDREKLLEGDFEVESSMGFGGSHRCRSTQDIKHRSADSPKHRSMTPTESTASCNAVRILTLEEFSARHPHPPSPGYVKIDRQSENAVDRQKENTINRQPPTPIDRRAPLTYRVQLPKIDVARLNALRPQPKPSDNPPEATSAH
ncbi:hypothetical protein DY000_02007232 [Brassica cretica]|uniref:DUF4005 domain-containing protein n=1 Tax=Brassica cretica TaxID=69181 RepID=A0ABQ7CJM5_BRACR|nr:hypothetical protein DY000_02007232 [Brassica cretica]